MTRRSLARLAAAALAVGLVLLLRARSPKPYATRIVTVMSTELSVTAPADRVDEATALTLAEFSRVEATANEWKPESALGRANRSKGQPSPVPPELEALLRRSLELAELSGGAFDPSWAALWGLWRFDEEGFTVPSERDCAARAALVDYRRIGLEPGRVTVPDGMAVGLGGIAKGWALDASARALRAAGIESALLSAGGHVMALGMRGDRPWRVGIRDPRGAADSYFAQVEVTDASVSTSGDYERFVEREGVRYHHILDVRTGRPARGLRSATVIGPDATAVDALSTAAFVLGRQGGLALVEGVPGLEAVLVDEHGGVHRTGGAAVEVLRPPTP